MANIEGERAKHRAAQIDSIKRVASHLIAEKGADGLSLRAVAREIGVVSSALYRYFANRDELLTALIYDAYNDLGASVERSEARISRSDCRRRWAVTCRAVRRWARSHPHEFSLLYGTPVPGYRAPKTTIEAASRVVIVMGEILSDSTIASSNGRSVRRSRDVAAFLDVDGLARILPGVPEDFYVRALMAWTLIFGSISFELFGHYVGSVNSPGRLFDEVVEELGELLGI